MRFDGSALLAIPLAAALAQTQAPNLLQRATDPNPALQSYVASASLAAVLHAAVPIHKTLTGVAYYLKPKQKIVFEGALGPLSKFKELTSTTPTYDQARAEYTITPVGDDGTLATYSLVPSKPGRRVKKLVLSIDDHSALVVRAAWSYTDGSTLSVARKFAAVGAFQLAVEETISARFTGYSVDGTLRLSDYRLNAPIPASVFAEKSS
jgi:hypothetical protein